MPDSMIVVMTRQSCSPRTKESIVASSWSSSMPVGLGEAHPGAKTPQALGRLVQRVDAVVEEEA